jgi:hypothetical protein
MFYGESGCASLPYPLLNAHDWLLRATVPAPRPHAVLRLTLPGLDIGADAWPAQPAAAGYIELWLWPHDGDDMQTILRIEGSPPQPRAPRQRPAPKQAPEFLAAIGISST